MQKSFSHTVSPSTKRTLIDSCSTFVTSVASLAITEKSMPGEHCEGPCYDVIIISISIVLLMYSAFLELFPDAS